MYWLVFTNLYVAGCGAALTAASYALLGYAPRVDAAVALVFCGTLVVYNLDRLVEPRPGDSAHEQWIERHRRPLWLLTLAASLGALAFACLLNGAALLSLIPASVISVGYCLPIVPWRGRWRRLKALPGMKLLLIAAVWTYATAGLPMLATGNALDAEAMLILLARFLFLAAVALPFDLPDMQRDLQSGIATLPAWVGVRRARWIAIGLALGAGVAGAMNPWPMAIAVVSSSCAAAALVAAMRPGRGVVYFMVLLDGMLLVQAGALRALASI